MVTSFPWFVAASLISVPMVILSSASVIKYPSDSVRTLLIEFKATWMIQLNPYFNSHIWMDTSYSSCRFEDLDLISFDSHNPAYYVLYALRQLPKTLNGF